LRRVEVHPDPELSRRFPDQQSARLRLRLRDGRTLEREQHDYEGFHTRPMSWDTVAAKFDRLAAHHADSGVRRRIVALVRRLDKFDHFGVEELTRLLMIPLDF
jgi:2-methylcitrate dehydratase